MAHAIEFRNVSKQFAGSRNAVERLSFAVEEGTTMALVGPSGCGKTTSLKMINRLTDPTDGEILVQGRSIRTLPLLELRRSLGYVIQYIGLFPHMTVADNIAVVPKMLKWPKAKIDTRVDELLELVGLPPTEYRYRRPRALSGGQQQRVGVARALAADPPILLMDEPFGALDPITRLRLQDELVQIQRKLHKTIVIVTHDMDEAVRLGDRIAVLQNGHLVQLGSPATVLAKPANDFVADLLGQDRLLKLLRKTTVGAAMARSPITTDAPRIGEKASLEEALLALLATGMPGAAVINDAGRIIGSLSAAEIVGAAKAAAC
ncbi:ABC transporter ATP-binding protein [Dongia soli]|uniref:ATP-binding cassette domain-containing protein n=1 Tax=Dongia soli TaxID=600628 RepID=A0ABU5EFK9_9PROT|nr:ATP-binding cassette domain-containing protein [Dongia soli]MDY0884391.1 ATP-binding cassette domain-containing protein [Dongia soli]